MTVIIGQAQGWQSGAAYIGYRNEIANSNAVLTSNGVPTGSYGIGNLATWDNDGFKTVTSDTIEVYTSLSGIKPVDSFGIYGHNLDTGGSVSLSYANDINNPVWVDVALTTSVPESTGRTIFVHFDSINARYWRVTLTNSEANIQVTNLFLGQALRMYSPPEIGYVPIRLGRNNKIINTKSDGGKFLGRSLIDRGNKSSFRMSVVPSQWVRDHWEPFMRHAETAPFYYAWDAVHEPSDAAYCYTDKMIKPPAYKSVTQMSVSLSFIAL